MKKLSKVLAVVLAVSILASLCSFVSFAESDSINLSEIYNKGTGYVSFGDSITRGYGASSNWEYEGNKIDTVPTEESLTLSAYNNISDILDDTVKQQEINRKKSSIFCRNVTGSFGNIVAEELGLSSPDNILKTSGQYWPIAQDAVTTGMILNLVGVEDNITDEEFLINYSLMKNRYESLLYYFGDTNSQNPDGNGTYGDVGKVSNIKTLVNGASLITVELGMSDIFYRAFKLFMRNYDLSDLDDAKTVLNAAKGLISYLYEGYENWKVQFPLFLEYINANKNDDCTVVVIGLVNSTFGLNVSEDVMVPVGNALSSITSLVNKTYKELSEKYGFIYLDISNVETGIIENEYTVVSLADFDDTTLGIATHPTPNGYKQISRMIINALEENEKTAKTNKNNIVVDLGRFSSVDYVMIDGIKVNKYSVSNSTLTIPCINRLAQTLTICVKNGENISVTTYRLDYDNGFTATRTYTTNNSKVATKITTATKNVVTKIKNIFKKK